LVRETLNRLADDIEVAAVRIGMLGSAEVAEVVTEFLRRYRFPNVVLDPVLRSSSGSALVEPDGVDYLRKWLLPICDVITPNLEEATVLAGVSHAKGLGEDASDEPTEAFRTQAGRLHELGSRAVVITGGDLQQTTDYLSVREHGGQRERMFSGEKAESRATHGTGCAFATAIACGLALGQDLETAVADAKSFVRDAIASAYPVGKGTGPMNHLFRLG
jgi:hydroxymethylpyrimidine/phosphomethylpyrimidine kinase